MVTGDRNSQYSVNWKGMTLTEENGNTDVEIVHNVHNKTPIATFCSHQRDTSILKLIR